MGERRARAEVRSKDLTWPARKHRQGVQHRHSRHSQTGAVWGSRHRLRACRGDPCCRPYTSPLPSATE